MSVTVLLYSNVLHKLIDIIYIFDLMIMIAYYAGEILPFERGNAFQFSFIILEQSVNVSNLR